MGIEQQISEILAFNDKMKAVMKGDNWDQATTIFQQRDQMLHQLLDGRQYSEEESAQIRDMIVQLQDNDQALIKKLVVQRDKLVTDVLEASNSQKALEAYSKNI